MRIFHCDRCGGVVAFTALSCPSCSAAIGYVCDQRTLRVIAPTSDPARFGLAAGVRNDELDDDRIAGPTLWRCMNAAWGCNWMLPADSGDTWCRSCRLTRGRP